MVSSTTRRSPDMLSPTAVPVLALIASVAVGAILTSLAVLLLHPDAPDGWPVIRRPKLTGRHGLNGATTPYRPSSWDEVAAKAAAEALADDEPEPEPDPIDELDPRWDWEAYLADQESNERELVAA